jgi:hypothetical protein
MAIKFVEEAVTKKHEGVTKIAKEKGYSVTPRKGRPPKGDRAMTGAERIKAYRERKRSQ